MCSASSEAAARVGAACSAPSPVGRTLREPPARRVCDDHGDGPADCSVLPAANRQRAHGECGRSRCTHSHRIATACLFRVARESPERPSPATLARLRSMGFVHFSSVTRHPMSVLINSVGLPLRVRGPSVTNSFMLCIGNCVGE